MNASLAYILAGVLLIACAGVGYGYVQHNRAEAAFAKEGAAQTKLDEAIRANGSNIETLGQVRIALGQCNVLVAENAERAKAAIAERDRMYGELAVKYDASRARTARVIENECKDWANEAVCVAEVFSQ